MNHRNQQGDHGPPQPLSSSSSSPSLSSLSTASSLPETWHQFCQAIRNPYEPFDPWSWLWRLFVALLDHVGIRRQRQRRRRISPFWRPAVPLLGLSTVLLIALAYYTSLRNGIVRPQWCNSQRCSTNNINDSNNTTSFDRLKCNDDDDNSDCVWIQVHDVIVFYLCFLVSFHYVAAMIRSPGVVLVNNNNNNSIAPWTASQGQGGTFGLPPIFNVAAEQQRLALYGPLQLPPPPPPVNNDNNNDHHDRHHHVRHPFFSSTTCVYFPTPYYASYCETCQAIRPPRCHHCHTCQRCILQYDHHCIWINNCVGFNNYRHFVLLLFHLSLACWYGSLVLLLVPFYRSLQNDDDDIAGQQQRKWQQIIFRIATPVQPHVLLYQIWTRTLSAQTVLYLVFPFLVAVASILTGFLAFHLYYIVRARTTLEQGILWDHDYAIILSELLQTQGRSFETTPMVNPYDQKSWWKNLWQILGGDVVVAATSGGPKHRPIVLLLLYLWLPLALDPMPPFIPKMDKSK